MLKKTRKMPPLRKMQTSSKYSNGSTIQNPGVSKNFPLQNRRPSEDRKASRYRTSLVTKKSKTSKAGPNRVSQLSRLSQYSQLTQGLRKKLKTVINRPEACNICDLFLANEELTSEFTSIVQELETYTVMKIEHYYGEENLFKFDKNLIESIQKSVKQVGKEINEKLKDATMEKFGKFDLAGKYLSVKKMIKLLSKAQKQKSELINDVKWHYYLGDPLMTALVTHLFDESEDHTLTASNKTSAEFVFKFIYENLRFFNLPIDLLEKMVDFHFELELPKRDRFNRVQKTGIYEGNEPLYPDEIVKATFKTYQDDHFYGEWREKKLYKGAVFSKSGEMYTGSFKNRRPHGKGYLRKSNGSSFYGIWKKGEFQHGHQILQYERGVFGELVDDDKKRTGVTVYHDIDLERTRNQRDALELEQCLQGKGASGIYIGCYQGEIRSGAGSMYFVDKSVYHGHWKKDKRHGKGTYYGVNREKYSGEWNYDKREGYGEMIFENGDHYEGEWYMDRMEGKGIYVSSQGEIREGTWKDNFFVSKLRDNKKIHDGIHQHMSRRTSTKKKKRLRKKTGTKIAQYLESVNKHRFGKDLLDQTKKIGL
jgi:hypothetical protein